MPILALQCCMLKSDIEEASWGGPALGTRLQYKQIDIHVCMYMHHDNCLSCTHAGEAKPVEKSKGRVFRADKQE